MGKVEDEEHQFIRRSFISVKKLESSRMCCIVLFRSEFDSFVLIADRGFSFEKYYFVSFLSFPLIE